jgi:hypothetical protein
MPTTLRIISCSVFLALAGASLGRAQISPGDKAAAEALFDQGLQLMRSGQYGEACAKLEQSQGIDHGIGTMLYLAECYEKSGRTASAWALFRQAASEAAAAGQSERADAGRRRAARIEPTLSKLTISVADPSPPGLEVVRNGEKIANPLWGVAVPVDPGQHQIEARAPGYATWSGSLRVEPNGAAASVLIPALVKTEISPAVATQTPISPLPEAVPVPAPAAAANASAAQQAPSAATRVSTQRVLGVVAGGVGVVALTIGAVFGAKAIAKNDDAGNYCAGGGARCTDPRGVTLTEDAKSAARLANVFVIGGAVAAAAGLVIYLSAPANEERALALSTDGRSTRVTLEGAF